MNVGIYLYDQAEVLDFSGPFEVFSTASRISGKDEPFNTFLVSETGETVGARGGYKVVPDYGFHNHPETDLLIIAGGVHAGEMNKPGVIDWISRQAGKSRIVASVCTGVFLLAEARVIRTHKVTTHWEDISDLKSMFPDLEVIEGVRWVDEGSLLTSGGISAGIDMSLHLVGRLYGDALAEKTARQMEFLWAVNP
jgi:transcriptional regulator GlxA family with amidase domain